MDSRGIADRGDVLLLISLLVGSLSLNVVLGLKIRALRQSTQPIAEALNLRDVTLSPLDVVDLDGRHQTIDFTTPNKPSVIYVLNPGCEWCDRNRGNLAVLVSSRGDAFRFVGLTLGGPNLKDYLEANKLGFPVFQVTSYDVVRKLGLGSTPQTLVVESGGKVVRHWVGAFSGPLQREVESYFGVSLPGLSPESRKR